jgi:hypothetical protein
MIYLIYELGLINHLIFNIIRLKLPESLPNSNNLLQVIKLPTIKPTLDPVVWKSSTH